MPHQMNQTTDLPPAVPLKTIASWLPDIFPDGTSNRGYVTREIAAKTIFVMFYTGAVEGSGRWLRPNQVTKMTDRQATRKGLHSREAWTRESLKAGGMKNIPDRRTEQRRVGEQGR